MAEYHAAAESDIANALPYARMGRTFFEQGRLVEAELALETAVSLNEKDVESFLNLSRIHLEQGRPDEALETVEKALAIDPRYPVTLELLARIRPLVPKAVDQKKAADQETDGGN